MLAVYKQIAYAADCDGPCSDSWRERDREGARVARDSQQWTAGVAPVCRHQLRRDTGDAARVGALRAHTRRVYRRRRGPQGHTSNRRGGGTVLLDEIGETSLALQVRLLRTIEEGEVRPLGAGRTIKVDARVISATNRDLEKEVAAQRFRQDLYYRLSVIVITVPPLRERRADIPLLTAQFLQNACARAGRAIEIAPDALDALAAYDWPGNVRELENTIERLVLFSRGSSIQAADLPPAIGGAGVGTHAARAAVRRLAVNRRARAPISDPRAARCRRQPDTGGGSNGD